MGFKFIDLFSGIGGFHAALSALGGECVLASDIDANARRVYADNWNHTPLADINDFANDKIVQVPDHEILVGGFPCQPFSKSGHQHGMEEARGTLFWNIAKIIEAKKPKIVLLENVRNLVGPRHIHEWKIIIRTLRELGYRVSESPLIVSPHQIKPEFGGRPQVRDRVLIAATRYPKGWSEMPNVVKPPDLDWALLANSFEWNLRKDLPLEEFDKINQLGLTLSKEEKLWLATWEKIVRAIKKNRGKLPGFPLWFDAWPIKNRRASLIIDSSFPDWKNEFILKNQVFFKTHQKIIQDWYEKNQVIDEFPPSRRKLEWQAQEAESFKQCVAHFRPSGIRIKRATYVPALVAITQTSILCDEKRRLTVREASRLQGFPDWFRFYNQNDNISYKQLGNAVNIGVIYQTLKATVRRDFDLLTDSPDLQRLILGSPDNPDLILADSLNVLNHKEKMTQLQGELPLRLVN